MKANHICAPKLIVGDADFTVMRIFKYYGVELADSSASQIDNALWKVVNKSEDDDDNRRQNRDRNCFEWRNMGGTDPVRLRSASAIPNAEECHFAISTDI